MIVDVTPEETVSKKTVGVLMQSFLRTIENQREQIDLLTQRNLELEMRCRKMEREWLQMYAHTPIAMGENI